MTIALASRNDQAAGLRRMFAGASPCFVPVVSNPHLGCGGVLLERLSTALVERGARVLVVDAAERAAAAGEMALIDLAQCVERLSPQSASSIPRARRGAFSSASPTLLPSAMR